MADHQRIHPVQDPEAPQAQRPTAPLVPRGSSRSDNGNPEEHNPPIRRTIPYSYEKTTPKRNCCRRCLCWTVCLILLLIIILGILAAIIYFVFQPKIPKYSVDSMRITQFNLSDDMSLAAMFNVNITKFYQGHRNTTVLNLTFESQSKGPSEAQAGETETDEVEILG